MSNNDKHLDLASTAGKSQLKPTSGARWRLGGKSLPVSFSVFGDFESASDRRRVLDVGKQQSAGLRSCILQQLLADLATHPCHIESIEEEMNRKVPIESLADLAIEDRFMRKLKSKQVLDEVLNASIRAYEKLRRRLRDHGPRSIDSMGMPSTFSGEQVSIDEDNGDLVVTLHAVRGTKIRLRTEHIARKGLQHHVHAILSGQADITCVQVKCTHTEASVRFTATAPSDLPHCCESAIKIALEDSTCARINDPMLSGVTYRVSTEDLLRRLSHGTIATKASLLSELAFNIAMETGTTRAYIKYEFPQFLALEYGLLPSYALQEIAGDSQELTQAEKDSQSHPLRYLSHNIGRALREKYITVEQAGNKHLYLKRELI